MNDIRRWMKLLETANDIRLSVAYKDLTPWPDGEPYGEYRIHCYTK